MAIATFPQPAGERRVQWQRLEKHWRDSLEDASGNSSSSALDIGTSEELKDALRDYRTDGIPYSNEKLTSVLERLSPALDSLHPFAKTIASASQYEEVSSLLWCGLLSVVEGASNASRIVPSKVLNLLLELCESIPSIELRNPAIYQFTAVQYAFQDLFEDYMGYCTQLCAYFRRPTYESNVANVFSRSPRGLLEAARSRIGRHVSKLRDAVAGEMQLLQTHQDSEIAKMLPSGISDMPRDPEKTSSRSSRVEFPVHTVNRARNSAFVGRDILLEDLAEKINRPKKARRQQDGGLRAPYHSAKVSNISSSRQSRSPNNPTETLSVRASNRESSSELDSVRGDATSSNFDSSPNVCVLHGLGGVGKTQVALEYYYEHRGEYEAVFWMEAEQDWTLASSFAKIADKLELLPKKTTDEGGHEMQNKAVEESRSWLQTTEHRWLLIYDNVEDFGDLARYMPTECRSNGTIIITTQSPTVPAWVDNAQMMQVKALEQEAAAMCIFKYLDREPENDEEHELACELASHVGCLPLAMATIGGYVKQSQISLAEFFQNIKQKATLWERAPRVRETQAYERSLISVFNKAFEDLTPAARELLNILAFCDPDSIPEEIFARAIEDNRFKCIHSKNDLLDCYFELRSRQLIRRDTSSNDSYISIHRVVQWNVLLDLSADYNKRWECFQHAFEIIQAMLPKTDPKVVPEPEIWPPYARHGRQILELRTHCLWPEPPVELPLTFARILAEMGTYMWFSGKFPEGEQVLSTAEHILDDRRAKWNDGLRAHTYQLLGIITSFEGVSERKRSMDLRRNAYNSRNQGLGRKPENERTRDEDIMVWAMHSDMAFGFIQEEDFDSTKTYMEDCLEQYQKWDRDEDAIPYEYSKYYQLMSFCHMAYEQPLESIKAITRCYELMQKAAGNDHPMTQLIKFCHANLLWHSEGRDARRQALRINKAVLEFRRQLLGEFSHFTLESYSTCGKLCLEFGEIDEARRYLETCLQRRKRAVWNEEGITRAQFRYANVLRALAEEARMNGDEQSSKDYIEDAEKIASEVTKIVQRYRKEYEKYMPPNEDEEENLDQMVSLWAGRFTGRLKQPGLDLSGLNDEDPEQHRAKRRRVE